MDNFSNLLKSQLLTVSSMNNNNDGNNSGFFIAIQGIIVMTLIENVIKVIPVFMNFLKSFVKEYYKNKVSNKINIGISSSSNKTCSIRFERSFKDKTSVNDTVDALLNHLCKINNTKHLLFLERYMFNNSKNFDINKNIKCRLISINHKEQEVDFISFELFSYNLELFELRKWINDIIKNYKLEKQNDLGDDKYFFNEINCNIPKDVDGSYKLELCSKNMNFTKTKFNTNKTLNNIFGEQIQEVKNRVDLFVNNPEWYQKRGIPHTLGLLLYGEPGTGKTSMIKAVAKETNRHIINISLKETNTQTQFKNLFFKDEINIVEDGITKKIFIPLNKRIYVIEDIDCLTNVVLDRKYLEEEEEKEEEKKEEKENELSPPVIKPQFFNQKVSNVEPDRINELLYKDFNIKNIDFKKLEKLKNEPIHGPLLNGMYSNESSYGMINNKENQSKNELNMKPMKVVKKKTSKNILESNSEQINLSFLLNLLDGVLENPGRILIITSNYPEKLDKALIRPGRIDLFIKFSFCTRLVIKQMIDYFYEMNLDINKIPSHLDKKMTPAELTSILCNYYNDFDKAFEQILNYNNNSILY
jgi:AAA+ superfamily predicted ATPase